MFLVLLLENTMNATSLFLYISSVVDLSYSLIQSSLFRLKKPNLFNHFWGRSHSIPLSPWYSISKSFFFRPALSFGDGWTKTAHSIHAVGAPRLYSVGWLSLLSSLFPSYWFLTLKQYKLFFITPEHWADTSINCLVYFQDLIPEL